MNSERERLKRLVVRALRRSEAYEIRMAERDGVDLEPYLDQDFRDAGDATIDSVAGSVAESMLDGEWKLDDSLVLMRRDGGCVLPKVMNDDMWGPSKAYVSCSEYKKPDAASFVVCSVGEQMVSGMERVAMIMNLSKACRSTRMALEGGYVVDL